MLYQNFFHCVLLYHFPFYMSPLQTQSPATLFMISETVPEAAFSAP